MLSWCKPAFFVYFVFFVFYGFSWCIFSFVLVQIYCVVCGFHPALILNFSVLAKRLAGKNISEITYLESSGTLNLNSVNQTKVAKDSVSK